MLRLSSFSGSQFQPDVWVDRLVHLDVRQLSLVLWILKLEVKELSHVGSCDLDLSFSQTFTEANSVSTKEGRPAAHISLFACRSQG